RASRPVSVIIIPVLSSHSSRPRPGLTMIIQIRRYRNVHRAAGKALKPGVRVSTWHLNSAQEVTEGGSIMAARGLPTVPAPPPGEAASSLEIRLFGLMEVRTGSRPLPRLRTRKGLWLLALLALRDGRDVERDWLAGTLWPEVSDADARRSLRQSLHDLRL